MDIRQTGGLLPFPRTGCVLCADCDITGVLGPASSLRRMTGTCVAPFTFSDRMGGRPVDTTSLNSVMTQKAVIALRALHTGEVNLRQGHDQVRDRSMGRKKGFTGRTPFARPSRAPTRDRHQEPAERHQPSLRPLSRGSVRPPRTGRGAAALYFHGCHPVACPRTGKGLPCPYLGIAGRRSR